MSKQYKRKQSIIANSRDTKGCNDIRKPLNSSERQRGKREAYTGVDSVMFTKTLIQHLRWDYEQTLSNECSRKERRCPSRELSMLLMKLKVGDFRLFKCECIDPDSLSDDEILKYFGYL